MGNILLPGDFIGLEGAITPIADRAVVAESAMTTLVFGATCLTEMLRMDEQLGAVGLWSIIQEASIVSEHLCCVGRRSATERVCHFLLEIWIRLRQIRLCAGETFVNPLPLADMADTLGLSEVHLSRTVKQLRESKLFEVDFLHRSVKVVNASAAIQFCGFDPSYLKFEPTQYREMIEGSTDVPRAG
jgi:CRP-like cAMP-binding protein